MGRKNPPNFVKRDLLIERLGLPKNIKLGKDELVLKAYDAGQITKVECEASFVTQSSTIPCYLYTHVQNQAVRDLIEKYVVDYSLLYSRGTWLANLTCIKHCANLELPDAFPTQENTIAIPQFLRDENLVKHCFLPERWLLKDLPIEQSILSTYNEYKNRLACLLPEYGKVMSDCGWDNAINHMGTSYLGNIHVMICTHLLKKLKTYLLEQHPCHPQSNRLSVWYSLVAPRSPNNQIHDDDYEWVTQVRESLMKLSYRTAGMDSTNDEWLREPDELNDFVWTLHLWLIEKLQAMDNEQEGKTTSYLPVSIVNRKFAYIDEKVYKSLVHRKLRKATEEYTQDHVGSGLQKMMGLTSKAFNKRRSKVRKDLKDRYKNKNNKKLEKKWKRIGHGCLSPKSIVNMVKTDGVGLRICVHITPSIQEVRDAIERANTTKDKNRKETEDAMFVDAFKVGIDTGRVRIATGADQDDKVFMITRNGFYRAFRDHRDKKFEEERMTGTAWGKALAALAAGGGFRNGDKEKWEGTLDAFDQHKDILINEQVIDKTRAMKGMRRFRWKKAFMEQKTKVFVERAIKNKEKVVLGIGDGDFSSTGRGEKSVPTKGFWKTLDKILKMHHIKEYVRIKKINEYNTTKCCHRCYGEMEKQITQFGKECLRYRLCRTCNKTVGKRRNRDVNAAKNMRTLVALELQGLPRPQAFRDPRVRVQG